MSIDIQRTPLSVSFGDVHDQLSTFDSSPLVPLGPKRLLTSTRRGVIFSPRNETKLFNSTESIITTKDASVHSYAIASSSSPSAPRPTPSPLSSSPSLVRPILKQQNHQIFLARSVEEGTMRNKEPARLLVTGVRPKLMARDSFQLAQLRQAGAENIKGKANIDDEPPGSDDSISSNDSTEHDKENNRKAEKEGEEEEEEEEVENLHNTSLISLILGGAENLLTIEEAYAMLTTNLRETIPIKAIDMTPEIREVIQPIRDQAPSLICAMQRDLDRLMGLIPTTERIKKIIGSECLGPESSPFRGLVPLPDLKVTPEPSNSRLTPSPDGPSRQGYTEAEVQYRRDASGVGAQLLRLLCFVFLSPPLHGCFSDADLQSLLEKVLNILRTPRLPTPNPKRTYFLSMQLLSQIRVNSSIVLPVKEKIIRGVESAVSDSLFIGIGGKENQVKKEAFNAVSHLVSTYPNIFFPAYSDFLPHCFRGMTSTLSSIRHKASMAAASFATAKIALLAEFQAEALKGDEAAIEAWTAFKGMVSRLETYVVNFFKGPLKTPGRLTYGATGEKRNEWYTLDNMFRNLIGTTDEVTWACTTWAIVVTLIGSAYNASPISMNMDHIMDRSLQESVNQFRPTLASAAWQHAVHAYLQSNSRMSIHEGRLIRSWQPFAASKSQDSTARLRTIFLPFDVAVRFALNPTNYARVLVPADPEQPMNGMRFKWDRLEKPRRSEWMVDCGLSGATLIYAFTGIALNHEDQPAKERIASSGLPSSDGPVADITPEDSKIRRLDDTFDKVLSPTLKSLLAINGVDKLKKHGWEIFEAVTDSSNKQQPKWSLERILTIPYLSGEFLERSSSIPEVLHTVDKLRSQRLRPSEIPSWGKLWTAKRLGKLLDLFNDAFNGMQGMSDVTLHDWIPLDDSVPREESVLFPATLSRIWHNLMHALAFANIPNAPPTPIFTLGLQAVIRFLVDIFERDPNTYVPLSQLKNDGTTILHPDAIRIQITQYLYQITREVLGQATMGSVRLPTTVSPVTSNPPHNEISISVIGSDSEGHSTAAGILLDYILRTKVLSSPTSLTRWSSEEMKRFDTLNRALREKFRILLRLVLDDGCAGGGAIRLLGDITNRLPWIFEDQEYCQLDVWRLLATKWTETVDVSPPSSSSTTNHTGTMLLSLLSSPFRGRMIESVWHQQATNEDLLIWENLLETAVLRFRAKQVGSNFGVLETLAGHLMDFFDNNIWTCSSTISLSCLRAATSYISFVRSEHHHGSHYNMNENYVPNDFFHLIALALSESYKSAQNDSESGSISSDEERIVVESRPGNISPALESFFDTWMTMFDSLLPEFVGPVLQPVQSALCLWFEDPQRVASELNDKLDEIHMRIIRKIKQAIGESCMEPNEDTIESIIQILVSRLWSSQSDMVINTFQEFWRTFSNDYQFQLSAQAIDLLVACKKHLPFLSIPEGILVENIVELVHEAEEEEYNQPSHVEDSHDEETNVEEINVQTNPVEQYIDEETVPAAAHVEHHDVEASQIRQIPVHEYQEDGTFMEKSLVQEAQPLSISFESVSASSNSTLPETLAYDADISQSQGNEIDQDTLTTIFKFPEVSVEGQLESQSESDFEFQSQSRSKSKSKSKSKSQRATKNKTTKSENRRSYRTRNSSLRYTPPAEANPLGEESSSSPFVHIDAEKQVVAVALPEVEEVVPVIPEVSVVEPMISEVSETAVAVNNSDVNQVNQVIESQATEFEQISMDVFGSSFSSRSTRPSRKRKRTRASNIAANAPRKSMKADVESTPSFTDVEADISRVPDSAEKEFFSSPFSQPEIDKQVEISQSHSIAETLNTVKGSKEKNYEPNVKVLDVEGPRRRNHKDKDVFVEASSSPAPESEKVSDVDMDGSSQIPRASSLIASTTRWLSKFHTIGSLFTPSRTSFDLTTSSPFVNRRTTSPERSGVSEIEKFDTPTVAAAPREEEDEFQLFLLKSKSTDDNEEDAPRPAAIPTRRWRRKRGKSIRTLRRAQSESDISSLSASATTLSRTSHRDLAPLPILATKKLQCEPAQVEVEVVQAMSSGFRGNKRTRPGEGAMAAADDSIVVEDEDELLLSLESARKRRKEEENVIALAMQKKSPCSERGKRKRRENSVVESNLIEVIAGPGINTVLADTITTTTTTSDKSPTTTPRKQISSPRNALASIEDRSPSSTATSAVVIPNPRSSSNSPLRRIFENAPEAVVKMLQESARHAAVIQNLPLETAYDVISYAQTVLNAGLAAVARNRGSRE